MKERLTYLLCLFLLCIFTTHATKAQETEPEPSIYVKALNKYAEWIKRFEQETDTLYFEELRGITTLFPRQVDGLEIVILTGRNQQTIYKDHDNKLIQRKMTPAKVTGKEIEIGIIPYQGRLEPQRGVILSLTKWHAIIFSYDPKAERFEYSRFENR